MQKELRQFLTDWIVEDFQPLYIVQSPSFRQLVGELDPGFVIPDEKGVKKVIYSAYDSMLLALIEKINIEAESISLTTDMWTARNGQGYILAHTLTPNLIFMRLP